METLSDKIFGNGIDKEEYWTNEELIRANDVKDFIKKLKEDYSYDSNLGQQIVISFENLDKLAGDKLI